MKKVFIGHRGVGKSTVLKRHSTYFATVPHFDLDKEIENRQGQAVSQIFSERGESYFRDLEKKVFLELIKNESYVIAVGGGFNPDFIPSNNEIIWIRRETDKDGRLFLNRPRLNTSVSPLQESLDLYSKRNPAFENKAHWVYDVPEGITLSERALAQEKILLSQSYQLKGILSLFPQHKNVIDRFTSIELRTDVWTMDQIDQMIVKHSLNKKIIVALRAKHHDTKKVYSPSVRIDEALEIVKPGYLDIISLHDCETIQDGIQQLGLYRAQHYKLSPLIDSFSDLITGYRWQQEKPFERSFLPRSQTGRWQWFRRYMFSKQDINFIRQNQNIDDQPTMFDLLADQTKKMNNHFVAVLGHPVHHSQSPLLHFDHVNAPFYKIHVEPDEIKLAFSFLSELGLIAAAITSPLKSIIVQHIQSTSLTEVNSVVKNQDEKWLGISTDDLGFQKLIQLTTHPSDKICVWGGQGVLPALQKIRSDVVCYSSRTGDIKQGRSFETTPDVVVWAAPRSKDTKFPFQTHLKWSPRIIVDLNYTDSSMGLEYAQFQGCQYVSGLEMLKEQGYHQRGFWKKMQENL